MTRVEVASVATGGRGVVYLDLVNWTSLEARKVITYSPDEEEAIERLYNRAYGLPRLQPNYPSIARIGHFIKHPAEGTVEITMDFVCGGTLAELMGAEFNEGEIPGFDFTQKLIMAFVMAKTVSFLHSQQIVYRDLKPEAWVIDDKLLPVLIDFGYSKIVRYSAPITYGTGALRFRAPEIVSRQRVNAYNALPPTPDMLYKLDVYAFGFLLYEMFTSQVAFRDDSHADIIRKVIGGERPSFQGEGAEACSVEEICERCWCDNPDDRVTMEEVIDMIVGIADYDFVDGDRFDEVVDGWEERVERAQDDVYKDEFVHGTVEKLEICAERDLGSAKRNLDLVKEKLQERPKTK
jgi:serine/threonine protein kinase